LEVKCYRASCTRPLGPQDRGGTAPVVQGAGFRVWATGNGVSYERNAFVPGISLESVQSHPLVPYPIDIGKSSSTKKSRCRGSGGEPRLLQVDLGNKNLKPISQTLTPNLLGFDGRHALKAKFHHRLALRGLVLTVLGSAFKPEAFGLSVA
jgi:hypothetical protein